MCLSEEIEGRHDNEFNALCCTVKISLHTIMQFMIRSKWGFNDPVIQQYMIFVCLSDETWYQVSLNQLTRHQFRQSSDISTTNIPVYMQSGSSKFFGIKYIFLAESYNRTGTCFRFIKQWGGYFQKVDDTVQYRQCLLLYCKK